MGSDTSSGGPKIFFLHADCSLEKGCDLQTFKKTLNAEAYHNFMRISPHSTIQRRFDSDRLNSRNLSAHCSL